MKQLFTLLIAVALFCPSAFAQSPITITSSDIQPFEELLSYDGLFSPNVSPMSNHTWDFSSYNNNSISYAGYYYETIPLFTNAGVDIYVATTKNLTSTLFYNTYSEVDFNANDVAEVGIDISAQAFDLSAFTGNIQDSIVFPAQSRVYPNDRRKLMEFPFTMSSSWETVSRRETDFILTVNAASLNQVPSKHVYYVHRHDTIVGWGQMRVYTDMGPSIYYDVLMCQTGEFSVDSFYIGGNPAPAQILSAFGVSQDQITNARYQYNFYVAGHYPYLIRHHYANDNTYSTVSKIYVLRDGITTATSIEENEIQFSTLVYPNPSNSGIINLRVMGKELPMSQYTVTDITGRTVASGILNHPGALEASIQVGNEVANGTYFLNVMDKDGIQLLTEQIVLKR